MTHRDPPERPPFAAHTVTTDKRRAGRTDASETPLELRTGGNEIDEALSAWVYERSGRQLGKFASHIERVMVRFGDENGPKGGVDRTCLIQVSLSSLPNVVVEERGQTDREAFDRAAGRAERATRHSLERHGFRAADITRELSGPLESEPQLDEEEEQLDAAQSAASEGDARGEDAQGEKAASDESASEPDSDESLIGGREGHRADNLMRAAERPEKERRDVPVDTSLPGVSASDRKAGAGHTAKRNTKLNTAGMTRALEDSTAGQPSRKSTRRSANRVKADNPLTRRTKSKVQSPEAQAHRARTRGH